MKRLILEITFLVLSAGLLLGESISSSEPIGQVIRGFSMPQTDAKGNPSANIMGDEASIVSVNRTEITNMKIDLYDGADVSTIITSPKCDLWKSINKLRTRDTVKITRPNMVITAQTMDWDYKEKQGVLRENVKVLIQNFALGKPLPDGHSQPPAAPLFSSPTNEPAPASDSQQPLPLPKP